MHDDKVIVLLATYNGERFLNDQLASLLGQTHTNWHLIARDDGSVDDTRKVLESFRRSWPAKITVLEDSDGNLGSVLNFNRLFGHARHERYVMFCDQDDYWLPEKVEAALAKMKQAESEYGKKMPLLVHTNFTYVDESLAPIEKKKGFHARKLKHLPLPALLAQSPVYGCTAMINQPLMGMVQHIPACAENHDCWLALVAGAFGKIVYVPESTVLYRQHGGNISTQHDDNSLKRRLQKIFITKGNVRDVNSRFVMAAGFQREYGSMLSAKQQTAVQQFLGLIETKKATLLISNLKNGVRKQTILQTMLFYASVFMRKGNIINAG